MDAWPDNLPHGVICFDPFGGDLSAGGAITGPPATGPSHGGPRWRATLYPTSLRKRDQVLLARALEARLEGGATPLLLPACDGPLRPQVPGGEGLEAVLAEGADPGAEELLITFAGGAYPPRGGEQFSLDHADADVGRRLYRLAQVIAYEAPSWRVRIVPALRASAEAEDPCDFLNPSCPMRLISGDLALAIEGGRRTEMQAVFEEWFESSPAIAEPALRNLTLSPSVVETASPADVLVGQVLGLTAGSALVLSDSAGGRFKLQDDGGTWNIYTDAVATDIDVAAVHALTLTETLAGYPNSPHLSVVNVTVQEEAAPPADPPRRFWGLFSVGGSSHATQTGLSSVGFAEVIGGALHTAGTAYSVGPGADVAGHGPDQAFDGNPGTYFRRTSNADGVGLVLDLGEDPAGWKYFQQARATVDFNDKLLGPRALRLAWADDFAGPYTDVDTSDTWGRTWLFGAEKRTNWRVPEDTAEALQHRVVTLANWGGIFVQVPWIEAWIDGVNVLPVGHVDDSLITGIASADNVGTQPAWHTWDGSMASLWIPGVGASVGHWFGWGRPEAERYDMLWLNPGDGGFNREMRFCRYETSNDGENWTAQNISSPELVRADALQQIYPL